MHRTNGLVAHHLALGAREAGDAEVHDLDLTVSQQHDVLGLNVPVDHTLPVGMIQCVQNLLGEMHHLFPGEGLAPPGHVLLEGNAVDVFHHDVLELVGDRHVEHLHNARMIQNGDGLGFILEPVDQLRVFQKFFPQDLYCHHTLVFQVHTFINVGHAAHAHQFLQQVAAVQLFAYQLIHLSPPFALPRSAGR